eukprot:g4980.t1
MYGHRGALAYDSAGVRRSQEEVTATALELLGEGEGEDKAAGADEEQAVARNPALGKRKRSGRRPLLALDVGCGTGMCGAVVGARGITWIGTDISLPMLARADTGAAGCAGLLAQDMSQGLPFRDATFDLCVSISAVHYLATPGAGMLSRGRGSPDPPALLRRFFTDLRRVLRPGARAVLQCTGGPEPLALIEAAALASGFAGSLVMDMPHRKQQDNANNNRHLNKHYLCLRAGTGPGVDTARGCARPQCPLAMPTRAACALWWRRANGLAEPAVAHDALHAQHVAYASRLRRMRQRSALWHAELASQLDAEGSATGSEQHSRSAATVALEARLKDLDTELARHEEA